ncbi:microcystin-dependent protein [Caulobacter ginsengisoli]|uniref:Microcystin-dependent protein n=1 Tax=Caulobacter ginsengisoli TaxID=400775 RepID=A0ABU0IN66_9CAUL|nr:tail fiber protein [Caulobacter ginsengisoli]MDQ0463399.1 microcystin-dependent protein [Caulobacter ginsengisoli]
MSDPYLGEMRMFAFDFTPRDWAPCNGQILQVSNYRTLFSLLGARYGGDGLNTFALPDLRAQVPVHQGQGDGLSPRKLGDHGGVANVTLGEPDLPRHSHSMQASGSEATTAQVAGQMPASGRSGVEPDTAVVAFYSTTPPNVKMNPDAMAIDGEGGSHPNLMPSLCVGVCMAMAERQAVAPTPYIGEIRIIAGDRIPNDWAPCDGQILQISQYKPLFSLLSNRYGGDGITTFALPNFQGRTVAHTDPTIPIGTAFGTEGHVLTRAQMPAHRHIPQASDVPVGATGAGSTPGPTKVLAPARAAIKSGGERVVQLYGAGPLDQAPKDTAIKPAGAGLPHENRQPFLTLQFILSIYGIMPSPH